MRPRGGARCWIAIINAFSHKELLRWSAMLQPTISRVAMSLIAAKYSQPSSVATYVMSAVTVHLPHNTGYIVDTAKFFGVAAEPFKTAC